MFARRKAAFEFDQTQKARLGAYSLVTILCAAVAVHVVNTAGVGTFDPRWAALGGGVGGIGALYAASSWFGGRGLFGIVRAIVGIIVTAIIASVVAGAVIMPIYGAFYAPIVLATALATQPLLLAAALIVMGLVHSLMIPRAFQDDLFAALPVADIEEPQASPHDTSELSALTRANLYRRN